MEKAPAQALAPVLHGNDDQAERGMGGTLWPTEGGADKLPIDERRNPLPQGKDELPVFRTVRPAHRRGQGVGCWEIGRRQRANERHAADSLIAQRMSWSHHQAAR